MVERIEDMPAGTIGFRATGKLIVSDAEWVKKAFRMFAWMTPGEVAVYDLDQEAEARDWVAAAAG